MAAACGGADSDSQDAPSAEGPTTTAAVGFGAAGDDTSAADQDEVGDAAGTGDGSNDEQPQVDAPADRPEIDAATLLVGGWSAAGTDYPTGEEAATISILDFGAVPDDGRSDSAALARAVASSGADPDRPTVVAVPAGRFILTDELRLRSSTVLRGEGPDSTLVIDFANADGPGITATGTAAGDWMVIQSDVAVGATVIQVSGAARLRPGQLVEIEQRTNPEEIYTREEWRVDWDAGSIGELNRVVSIDGSSVELASPLNGSYRSSLTAAVRPINPVQGIGIENLTITRADEGYGNTIAFTFATDIWLDGVESTRTSRAHIGMSQIYRCRVSNSIFHDATDFGDGGRAYGISLARHVTGCLVTDNTLYDLRHAIIIQLGASGNVIAYNDARGSAGYADRQPRADLSLHGHWPQANLFEGNVFDRVVFADWWGPSGPANTLFRNCVLDHVLVADASNDQVVAGNLIGPGGLGLELGITGTTLAANRTSGDNTPVDASGLPESLVAASGLAVADGRTPIDPAQGFAGCRIPASERSPFVD